MLTTTHALTDAQFKKIAKGIKKRLNTTLPDEHALSHHAIMQALSQEMYSMSYEEAKVNVLSSAKPPMAKRDAPQKGAHNQLPLLGNDNASSDFAQALLKLHHYIPLGSLPELANYQGLLYTLDSGDLELFRLNMLVHEHRQSKWETVADKIFGTLTLIGAHDAKTQRMPLKLSALLHGLTLPAMLDRHLRGGLPGNLRLKLDALLSMYGSPQQTQTVDKVFETQFAHETAHITQMLNTIILHIESDTLQESASAAQENLRLGSIETTERQQLDHCLLAYAGCELNKSDLGRLRNMLLNATKLAGIVDFRHIPELMSLQRVLSAVNAKHPNILSRMLAREDFAGKTWEANGLTALRAYGQALPLYAAHNKHQITLAYYLSQLTLSRLHELSELRYIALSARAALRVFLSSVRYTFDSEGGEASSQHRATEDQFRYVTMQPQSWIDSITQATAAYSFLR